MTVNYQRSGSDLAIILDPLGSGWPQAAATGYLRNGADLSTLFAAAASGTASSVIGYLQNGVDIGSRFALIGSTTVQVSASTGTITYNALGASGTTSSVTVTASKGKQSGYTYSWTQVSSTGGIVTINNPTSPTTTVNVSNINGGQTFTGVIKCTVSDGTTSASVNVNWSAHNTFSGGTTVYILASSSASGTIVFPVGANILTIAVRGGGGGGGVGTTAVGGGGGGQGGLATASLNVGTGPLTGVTSFSYTMTLGGQGHTTASTVGAAGGNTSLTAGTCVLHGNGAGGGGVSAAGVAGTASQVNGSSSSSGAAGAAGTSSGGGKGGSLQGGPGDAGFGGPLLTGNTTATSSTNQNGNGAGGGGDIFRSGTCAGGQGAVAWLSYLFQ